MTDVDTLPRGDVTAALALAPHLSAVGAGLADPTGFGHYVHTLRSLGAHDLTSARVVEPHLDACAILAQAGTGPDAFGEGSTWGVYASRAPGLHATEVDGQWFLDGDKPWCSLADRLDRALVTAGTSEGQRLFVLDLGADGVDVLDQPWVARGLADIRSTGLRLHHVPVAPVEGPNFYLDRPGFAWGGIGVAAVWAGGVDALTERVHAAARDREPDQIALLHLGRLDALRHVIDATLADAVRQVETGCACGPDGALLAARVRCIVAEAGELALTVAGHALGPGPMTGDERHARLVGDLTVYLRQHHAERSLADLGRQSLGG
ncbi:acyl-CoA dehydrogenase family protein [Luteococcus sp. H138]|uniref:acyl-CoA dehydrogenase family protein n=1 Tax=unclassified Luteococcus TaxID=2639923 RepID=UPI00313E3B43